MNRDEIIELAKQAGFDDFFCRDLIIERLAHLVAEKEREACAVTAWTKGMELHHPVNEPRAREVGSECAKAIRARGNE